MRGKGWYDYTLDRRGVPHGSSANGDTPGARLDDSDFEALSKFSGASLLDAYVYAYGTTEPLEQGLLADAIYPCIVDGAVKRAGGVEQRNYLVKIGFEEGHRQRQASKRCCALAQFLDRASGGKNRA